MGNRELGRAENNGVSTSVTKRQVGGEGVGAGFDLGCHFTLSPPGSVALPVPVSVGAFSVRWGVQAVGQVLVAVTGTVGHVGS